jgi:uncharacterized membrane protein YdjX (TVP38/TMEM64 family)
LSEEEKKITEAEEPITEKEEKATKEEEKITIGTMFWVLVVVAIVALTALFVLSDELQGLLNQVIGIIYGFEDAPVILGFVFFGIMIVQSIVLPIPSELTLVAGGTAYAAAFPTNLGLALLMSAIIGYIGSICGALLLFYLGRKGGRPVVIKLLGKSSMNFVDNWFKRWGGWAVGLSRLLPIIFFDPISLVSGATDIKFKHYIYGTLAGTVPRAIFYCGIGVGVVGAAGLTEESFTLILFIIICFGLIMLLVYWLLFRRYAKQPQQIKNNKEEASSA